MSRDLTENALQASLKSGITPQLVLEIDGVPTIFGALEILKAIQIGDPGLLIGGGWVIGGSNPVADQENIITLEGTSTRINQQLMQDKGAVSSVSSVQIQLMDRNDVVTELISPGFVVEDILFRRATLYLGFDQTNFPEDYVSIFKGFIDEVDSGPGNVRLNISHPDQKKRQNIFEKAKTKITTALNNVTSYTVLAVESTANFLTPVLGPNGLNDPSLKFYVRINDEIFRYTGVTATTLTGVTRAQLGTVAANHSSGDTVDSFYTLEGNVVDLALKLMLSGVNGYFRTDVEIEAFNQVSPTLNVPNAIFFDGVNVEEKYGLISGDYVTTSGALNGANNVTLKQITSIVVTDEGSYIVLSGVSFVTETDSAAVISFRSQYDTLGEGLQMTPEDVDVEEHQKWQILTLSSFEYLFYLRDTVEGKDFIDKQIYLPAGAFSIPRKAKASMGYHIGPVPLVDITFLTEENVKNPSRLRIKRGLSRYFENTVVYAFDEDVLEDGKFLSGVITQDATSVARIPVGNKVRTIESKGMRAALAAGNNASTASSRRLGRYKLAAEYLEKVQVFYKDGFNLDIGDLVLFDFTNLKVSNSENADREKRTKFFEIQNKTLDFRTGQVEIDLVDTNFDSSERYGLISPSSILAVGSTTTVLVIQDSYGAIFPGNEKKKWEDYVGLPIQVHDENYTYVEEVILASIDPTNPYKLNVEPLSAPPPAGYIVDIPDYSTSTDKNVNAIYKAIHAHFSPTVSVVTGVDNFSFTVGAGDVAKFHVGLPVEVHTEDFSFRSGEINVASVVGVTITLESDMGFTPDNTYKVDFIGFPDEDQAYRIV